MKRRKKSNKTRNIVLGITIPLVILLITFSVIFMTRQTGYPQGLTVKSISLAYPSTSGKNTWVIDVLVNGWGQSVVGNLDSNDIKYEGNQAEYPLTITGQISDNKGFYLIDNSNPKTIFQYRVETEYGTMKSILGYISTSPAPACDGIPIYEFTGEEPTGFLGLGSGREDAIRWCIYKDDIAVVSPISSSPNIIPKVELTIDAKGDSESITLEGQGVKTLPNNLGSVSWVNSPVQAGSLGALSIGNQYIAVAPVGTENWKVAYRNNYEGGSVGQSWSSTVVALDNKLTSIERGQATVGQDGNLECDLGNDFNTERLKKFSNCVKEFIENDISPANNLANKVVSSNVKINNRFTNYNKESNQEGFWVDLGNVYATAPELIIKIDSDWIGIKYPEGQPRVINVNGEPKPFKSGTPLTVSLTVKNEGEGTGNFIIQDIVCGSLTPQSTIYPRTVKQGQTETIVFSMTSSYKTEETGVCKGKVVDTGSLKSDTWKFSYIMEQPSQCEEDKLYWFGGNLIQICKDGKLVDYKKCDYGVVADEDGDWVCAEKPSGGNQTTTTTCGCWIKNPLGGCIMPDLWCRTNQWMTSKVILAGMLLGVLTFLIALFVIPSLAEKYNVKNQNKAIPFFIALIIGAITFALVLWLWWVALIVIFILILIKLFFKR